MEFIAKFIGLVHRYLKTCQMLLLHPDRFVKITLRERDEKYIPPVRFLLVSLIVLNYVVTLFAYLAWQLLDPEAPMNPKMWELPSQSIVLPSLVQIAVQAFLWYAILHRWLGHKLTIVTTTPYRRIFKELVYIEAPLAAIGTALLILGYLLFQGVLVGSAWTVVNFPDIDLPDFLSTVFLWLFALLLVILMISLLLAPGWFLIAFYNTVIATNLFDISRKRAIRLCLLLAFVSSLPIGVYGLWRLYLTPLQLSDTEVEAAHNVQAICTAEMEYHRKNNVVLSLQDLQKYYTRLPSRPW